MHLGWALLGGCCSLSFSSGVSLSGDDNVSEHGRARAGHRRLGRRTKAIVRRKVRPHSAHSMRQSLNRALDCVDLCHAWCYSALCCLQSSTSDQCMELVQKQRFQLQGMGVWADEPRPSSEAESKLQP